MLVHLRSKDRHDFGLDLGVCEGFYPVGEIALWGGSVVTKRGQRISGGSGHTVTVTKRIPDPGK